MGELRRGSYMQAVRERTAKQAEHVPIRQVRAEWRRFANDSLLAIAGVTLATVLIATSHLYSRIPSIGALYLLVIIVLASIRGRYAAILASLLASLAFGFFIDTCPEDSAFPDLDDLLNPDLMVFLVATLAIGQLTAGLRRHAEQARRRENETRRLSEQAQELSALQERQRLARELHDSVSQTLYGIGLGAHTAREALETDPHEAIAALEYVIDLTGAVQAEMRALIFELRPEALSSEGFISALSKQVAVLRTRYNLSVDAQLGEEPALSLESKQDLYRIAQEALHNVVKHACASTIKLRLTRLNGELVLEVCDDGQGFDPTGPFLGHLGLSSIQERAARLGGTCSIESVPSQGTLLRVYIPAHDKPGSVE